jgi:hypothetical protein
MGTLKIKTDKKGNRITSNGNKLPKGIYLKNKDSKNPTYRAYYSSNNKLIYVGIFKSINKAVKARKEAMSKNS